MFAWARPRFTESHVPDLEGKVFVITGGTAGIGLELAKILYHSNASRIYLLSRSGGDAACEAVASSKPLGDGRPRSAPGADVVRHVHLDLSDLASIRATADAVLEREARLDVVWHNAGIMLAPDGAVSAQGHELTFATNVLGPFLLQHFLTPLMMATTRSDASSSPSSPPARICWAGSGTAVNPPGEDGVQWDDWALAGQRGLGARTSRYMQSKAANAILAAETAVRHPELVSCGFHPGMIRTNLSKHAPAVLGWWHQLASDTPRKGALAEAYAGLSPELTPGASADGKWTNGGFVVPPGEIGHALAKVEEGIKSRGSGKKLWELCESLVKEFY